VSVETSLVGRIAGAALTAIAIASWMARADAFTPAQRGLLSGLFIYNAVVCALFAFAASVLQMSGVLSWPAVALHAALAIWCLTCLLPDRVEVAKDTAAN
jgi:hypothetical protein